MPRASTSTAVRLVVGLLVVLVVGTVIAVVVTVRGADVVTPTPAPTPPPSTLGELDRADPAVARGAFCDRVAPGAVRDALGAEVASERAYQNGDTAQVDPTTDDVAHEFGCTWTSETGTVVRAWVFAPPVTRARAKVLTRSAPAARGCSTYAAEGFGNPGVAFSCTGSGLLSAGHGGLFGDAWLTCTLAAPLGQADAVDVEERADRWCVAAAVGAATPGSQPAAGRR